MGTKVINGKAEDVLLSINFRRIAIVTVSLPAVSLLYCFVTGIIFRFDEVNETVCKVRSYIFLNIFVSIIVLGNFAFCVKSDI